MMSQTFAERFANLRSRELLFAGAMSGIVAIVLIKLSPLVGIPINKFHLPMIYAFWVADDLGYRIHQNPVIFVIIGVIGGLFGQTMNNVIA